MPEWKSAVSGEQEKNHHQPVTELHGKKIGSPSTFPEDIVHDAGGDIKTTIAIGVYSFWHCSA